MGTIDSMKSVLTQFASDALCENFHIPDIVHPKLPGRNDRIRNSPAGKIGVYSRFYINSKNEGWMSFSKRAENAPVCNTRPLDSLKNLNDHFFWVDAFAFPLDVPWYNNKPLRKDPHPTLAEFNVDVCNYLADNPAPFRKFLEPFLCFVGISRYYDLDENCYPTFWANDDEEMDLFDIINHADPTKVRIGEREVAKGEVSLLQLTRDRVVPLAGVNNQGNVNVQGASNNYVNEEGGDAAKADQTEQSGHVPKRVRKKRKAADGASGFGLPPKKLREDHGTSGIGASTGGKYVTALQSLLEGSTLPVKVGVMAVATVPLFVISSDTPHDSCTNAANDEVSSVVRSLISDPAVMTMIVTTTVVADTSALMSRAGHEPVHHILFADSTPMGETNPDTAGPSQSAGIELSSDTFFMVQDMDAKALQQTYVPKWIVINDSALDDPDVCHGAVDHLAPPLLFSQLCSMDYEQLLTEFNARAARQNALALRLGYGWSIILEAQLSLREVEAVKAICLCGQISTIEAVEAARTNELDGLKEQNAILEGQVAALESAAILSCDKLSIKASSLESDKDKLIDQVSQLEGTCSGLRDEVMGYTLFKEQVEVVQDEQVKALSGRVTGLDSDIIEMALHMDEEFYPHYLTTIAGQRWILGRGLKLVVMKCLQSPVYLAALGEAIGRAIEKSMQDGLAAGIDHGKTRRGLVNIAAHNPSTEANYVSAINALCFVDFPFLAQLESRKDTSMADIMDLLHLEGPAIETSEASQLQPSHEQLIIRGDVAGHRLSLADVMVPLVEPLSVKNLTGEASTSRVPAMATTTALSTTFIQASIVPPVPMTDPEVSNVGPSTKVSSPPAIVFEKETLETMPKHGASDKV
ncbi:hypothetical protein Tco_1156639 [Tanacetum coccineum]